VKKVCVAMVTYNHEKFIARALDSILMQKTSFDYEIVIGEDCSADKTREILLNYRDRYPEKIRLLLNEKNLGMHENGSRVMSACKGQYIAMLDGDDYWTVSEKLQKQVDFLDSHPDCAACYHDTLIIYEDGSKEPSRYRPSQKEFSTVEDLFFDNFIPTSAVLFRSGLYDELPDWVSSLKMRDWLIHIMNALYGRIGYLDEIMSVYVVHPGGVWSLTSRQFQDQAILEMFEALASHLGPQYKGILQRILLRRYLWISEQYEIIDDMEGARKHAMQALKKRFLILFQPMRCVENDNLNAINSMSHNLKLVSFTDLFRRNMRLSLIPALHSYTPSLYRFLRAVAHQLNLGL
jgi:glycosyltransferase involved in cell wall biosynthesis